MARKKKKRNKETKKTVGMYGDEQDDDDYEPNSDEEYFSKSDGEDSDGEIKAKRISVFCNTKYLAVKEAGKDYNKFHLSKRIKSDWDIAWFDGPPKELFVKEMKPWQRVNHFPGIYNLCKKNMLGRHLMRMLHLLPKEFTFFPHTYMLPHDYKDFYETASAKPRTFIVKPDDSC